MLIVKPVLTDVSSSTSSKSLHRHCEMMTSGSSRTLVYSNHPCTISSIYTIPRMMHIVSSGLSRRSSKSCRPESAARRLSQAIRHLCPYVLTSLGLPNAQRRKRGRSTSLECSFRSTLALSPTYSASSRGHCLRSVLHVVAFKGYCMCSVRRSCSGIAFTNGIGTRPSTRTTWWRPRWPRYCNTGRVR